MKKILLIAVITLINFKVGFSQTQLYLITNVAGNGVAGYSGNGGQATAAELNIPYGIATVPGVNEGEIFISDRNNQRVRTLLSPDIFNFAGNGVAGYSGDGGQATAAELNYPYGVAEDASGNVYIADYTNERIRKVNTSGVISTFAGNGYGAGSGFGSYSGDGGQATAAELNNPIGVAVDGSGIVYIADLGNHRIRKVGTGGVITTIAGNGSPGYNGDNINATAAELYYPEGVAVDASNNLYIADYLNQRIRKVNLISGNIISTVAGNGYGAGGNGGFSGDGGQATAAELNLPNAVTADASGNIYIADNSNERVRMVNSSGVIYTIAGNGTQGFNGDFILGTDAELDQPSGVAAVGTNIYVVDFGNSRVRELQPFTCTLTEGTPTVTNVSCNGGTNGIATATPSGGTSPYTYSWTGGGSTKSVSNLSAGTYSVTVTDIVGCTASSSVTVTQPSVPFMTEITSVTNPACNSETGTISVNPVVVTETFSYEAAVQHFTVPGGVTSITVTVTGARGGSGNDGAQYGYGASFTGNCQVTPSHVISIVAGGAAPLPSSVNMAGGGGGGSYVYDSTVLGIHTGTPSLSALLAVAGGGGGGSAGTISGASGGTDLSTNAATLATATAAGGTGGSGGATGIAGCYNGGAAGAGWISNGASGTIGGSNGNYISNGGNDWANNFSGGAAIYIGASDNGGYGGGGGGGVYAGGGGGGYNGGGGGNDYCGGYEGGGGGGGSYLNGTVVGTPTATNSSSGQVVISYQNPGVYGGTSPYTYSWSGGGGTTNTASGITAGTYTLTVTDNHGCTATASATLTQPASLGVTIASVSNISCNEGMGVAAANTPTGGTSPYTYSWSGGGGTTNTASGITAGTYTLTVTDNHGCTAITSANITQPAAPLSVSIQGAYPDICDLNGIIAANTATGGTPPYTYSWSPSGGTNLGINNVPAGSYTITVTDYNHCTNTASIGLSPGNPPVYVNVATVNNISCYGGTGSATVNTNVFDVQYGDGNLFWLPSGGSGTSASNLSAGTYTVNVSAQGGSCFATCTVTITQPPALGITIASATPSECSYNAGSVTSNAATGGTPPYTYSWSPTGGTNLTASNLPPNNYTITVTDNNNCSSTTSIQVFQGGIPVQLGIVSQTNINCYGGTTGSATVMDINSNSDTYSWEPSGGSSNSASNLSAGTYTVLVESTSSCWGTITVTITQPAAPLAISLASITNGGCSTSGSATANAATGGTPPYTYSWSPSGGSSLFANGLSGGTFTITATDNNGCAATASATITQSSGIGVSLLSVINPSCNPNSGSITFNTPIGGTPPYTYAWIPSGGNNLTATGLSGGSYTIIVFDNSGCLVQASATITQSAGTLKDTAIVMSNATCYGTNNGSAYVNISAGASPFTYSWSNGLTVSSISGLSAGTYSITVEDNNGCSSIQSITIKQPAAINLTMVIQNNVSCYSGSNGIAKVGVSGGTVPFTYSWSNGSTTYLANNLGAGTYTLTASDKNGCSISAAATITQPVALGASVSITYPNCVVATGSASVSVTGGTLPYVYTWSPPVSTTSSATGLALRTYVVSLKDAHGCTSALTFIISQPPVLRDSIIRASVAEVPCGSPNSGSATAGTKYGTQPYTYSWSNGSTLATASGLSVGTYTVTVRDANACSAITSVTITQTPGLTITTIVPNNVSCYGGTNGIAKAAVSGGVSPYTYSWSPGGGTSYTAYTLSAGIYTVSVTDKNGCNNSATATITQPVAIRDSVAYINNATCHGGTGSAGVGVKGGTPPYAYIWSPPLSTTATATGLTARTYVVSIKDADGCAQSLTFSITQPLAISLRISSNTCSAGSGIATVGVTGGASPYTYSWSPNVNSAASASGLTIGTYTITVSDNNGCSNSIATTVTCPPGIVPHEDNGPDKECCSGIENITLYPNPNSGQFTIAGVEKGMLIEVYDYTGRKISVITANNETMQLNISNQSNGLYLIRITDKDGNLVSQKKVVKTQ